ncbi:hypothetical protein ACLFKT_20950, partial [Paraburkholderia sp. BR14261]
ACHSGRHTLYRFPRSCASPCRRTARCVGGGRAAHHGRNQAGQVLAGGASATTVIGARVPVTVVAALAALLAVKRARES